MNTFTQNRKILYVDDEPNLLASFESLMRKEAVKVFTLQDPTQIETMLAREGPFALVMSDQRMPGLDGVAVLEKVAQHFPDTIRIMVTGFADHGDTLRAINIGGIRHYISKPWNDQELRMLIQDLLIRYNLEKENAYLVTELKTKNDDLTELLDGTMGATTRLLSDLVAYVNPAGAAQAERIRRLGTAVVKMRNDLSEHEQWEILRALDLFNLGLTVLPPWVQVSLNKEGLPAIDRFPVARNHHLIASGLLRDIPRLSGIARIIKLMHKDFDGSGEPADDPSHGKEIPFGSRLLHILLDLDRLGTVNFKGREVLQTMMHKADKYDTELMASMLDTSLNKAKPAEDLVTDIDGLKVGMRLLEDITTQRGVSLLRSDAVLTETALNVLKQWNRIDPIAGKIRVRIEG